MKPSKVFWYGFLFPIFGVDHAQNLSKYNTCVRVTNQKNITIMHSALVRPCQGGVPGRFSEF